MHVKDSSKKDAIYNWTNDAKVGRDVGTCLYCKTCMWRIDPMKCPGKLKYQRKQSN